MEEYKNNIHCKSDSFSHFLTTIQYLKETKDYTITKAHNQERLRVAVKELAQKGLIRTHAFYTNWIREIFEHGEITSKTIHEIVGLLPFVSWDQTKKYLDSLTELGLVNYSRDSIGQKVCFLPLEKLLVDNKTAIPLQLAGLFEFLKNQKQIPVESLSDIRNALNKYYTKQMKLKSLEKEVEEVKKEISCCKRSAVKELAEKLATLYYNNSNQSYDRIVDKIKFTLIEEGPSLIYSLKLKR